MRLKTKVYAPVAEGIQIEYNPEDVPNGTVLAVAPNKMTPFVEADVLAAGPLCKQVKAGDKVLVNSATIMRVYPGRADEVFFTVESKLVAIIGPAV